MNRGPSSGQKAIIKGMHAGSPKHNDILMMHIEKDTGINRFKQAHTLRAADKKKCPRERRRPPSTMSGTL